MQKLKCAHKNVAWGRQRVKQKKKNRMKSKTGKQTFCKYYYNIFCHLFILFGGVCGCAGYFIIFAGCMIINLHLNHRRRRPCLAQTIGPFGSVQLFFSAVFCRAVVLPAVHFLEQQTVCECVDIHTTLLTTKCHMILFWPLTLLRGSLPALGCLLALPCCTCNMLAFIFWLCDFQRW